MDIATLSRNLGHANISATLSMYIYWMDDQQRASVQIFDQSQFEVDEDSADNASVLPEEQASYDLPNASTLAAGMLPASM